MMDFKRMNAWYAYIFEKQVIDVEDVELMKELIGHQPKKILEVACGGGRILSQLAKVGHEMIGFDYDEAMLAWCQKKIENFHNATCFQKDALKSDWGDGYDVVILAGNLLLNLITNDAYVASQELLIKKASKALKAGGYLYLDFDCYDRDETDYVPNQERIIFEGQDTAGTKGKYIAISGTYDAAKKIEVSSRRYEITDLQGHTETHTLEVKKYFPSLEEVLGWLEHEGFDVVNLYGDFNKSPISSDSYKAIIWAKKA